VATGLFLDILTSPKDPETTLRRMNEAGVFGNFMPEFGRVVAQMQHDMYHVYTVDEHTIRAIGVLSRIEKGDLIEDHPLATKIVHKVVSRRVLYLAVLLHDIAKGRGGDHSVIGEGVAWKVGGRLHLEEEETETVAWLVRHHLAMSHTAMKRDINDPKTIADFVALVQSPERLRLLLVLTVADIRAVGPGRWNGWNGELLRALYHAAEEAMAGGHGIAPRADRLAHAHSALARVLTDWSQDEIAAHIARCYPSYWLSLDGEAHVRIARMMHTADRSGEALSVDTRVDHARAVTEVTVYAADHPGLFARVTGALALNGATIVDAKIHTTTDGMAIDVFSVQGVNRGAFEGADRLERLRATIGDALAGRIQLASRLAKHGPQRGRTGVFIVRPRALIDNKASDGHTVIEVNGRDRSGFLYDVARTLSHLGLTIASAHITTFGERAVDVFYVKDVFGSKIVSKTKLDTIRADLLKAIGGEAAPQPRPSVETASAAE
jgi:[protein-PII] uridylyltransferase